MKKHNEVGHTCVQVGHVQAIGHVHTYVQGGHDVVYVHDVVCDVVSDVVYDVVSHVVCDVVDDVVRWNDSFLVLWGFW